MELYLDASRSPRERAKDLLARLSLAEKLAQTVCIYPNGLLLGRDSVESARKDCPCGIGAISGIELRALPDAGRVADYQRRMQTMAMEQSPHHIPALIHMEGLCGGYLAGTTSLPAGINRGASFDPQLEEQLARIVSRQEKVCGIHQILAPVLDIARDPRMGRFGESYGEDSTLAAAMGVSYTRGIQEQERSDGLKADAVAKHFAGFHNSQGGIHGADSLTPPRLLREIYAKPFAAAISEGRLKGIMPCYCTLDGDAASTSKPLLRGLLREELGFDGLCVSDYTAIENTHREQGLYESMAEAGLRAMEAGMDMEWPRKAAYNDELARWFEDGKADIALLDELVERILETKFRLGLFEHPFALSGEALNAELNREGDAAASQRMAEESIVLLKNNGVLPLSKKLRKIVVIGPHGDSARSLFGGYTHVSMAEALLAQKSSIAGFDETGRLIYTDYEKYPGTGVQVDTTPEFASVIPALKPGCKSLYEELKDTLGDVQVVYAYGYPYAGNDRSRFAEALDAARDADLLLLTLGGKYSSGSIATMGEGVDATEINLPECQDAFLAEAAKLRIPMVGIHFGGRPVSSDAADTCLDALLEAFAPAEGGAAALVNLLTGVVNPSGRLPVSVAYSAGQLPVYYNHPMGSSYHQGASIGFPEYVDCTHAPRYPFGYGLSYTSFAYSGLTLSAAEVRPDEDVEIGVTVKNTGSAEGCDVVQLYLKDTFASKVRPCMELGGFARVALRAGEEKRVVFTVSPSQLAFLDDNMEWKIEAGEIQVAIGRNAGELCLKDSFRIASDARIDGKARRFYAGAAVEGTESR